MRKGKLTICNLIYLIRNQESFIRGNLQYMQFTKGYIQFLLYILMWVVGCCKIVWLVETHINWYRNEADVCNAVMVRQNPFVSFKEHAYVAIWLLHERCSRPRSETFIWCSWLIWSYIHLYGLEISIKASCRYHGNHQEKNMSNDEAPCEAFNLMHILELPIIGHIKPNEEFFVRYINKIYNTNDSVPIAGLNDSHSILL